MIMMYLLSWWYTDGLLWRISAGKAALANLSDSFSFGQLLRTLFAPYRQSFAGRADGPLGARFQAFVDRSVSRLVGFTVRMAILVSGLIMMLLVALGQMLFVALWPLLPLLPLVGIVAALGSL